MIVIKTRIVTKLMQQSSTIQIISMDQQKNIIMNNKPDKQKITINDKDQIIVKDDQGVCKKELQKQDNQQNLIKQHHLDKFQGKIENNNNNNLQQNLQGNQVKIIHNQDQYNPKQYHHDHTHEELICTNEIKTTLQSQQPHKFQFNFGDIVENKSKQIGEESNFHLDNNTIKQNQIILKPEINTNNHALNQQLSIDELVHIIQQKMPKRTLQSVLNDIYAGYVRDTEQEYVDLTDNIMIEEEQVSSDIKILQTIKNENDVYEINIDQENDKLQDIRSVIESKDSLTQNIKKQRNVRRNKNRNAYNPEKIVDLDNMNQQNQPKNIYTQTEVQLQCSKCQHQTYGTAIVKHQQSYQQPQEQEDNAENFDMNEWQSKKFTQKRNLVRIFCVKGYSYSATVEQLYKDSNSSITKAHYKSTMATIMRNFIRKLQYILVEDCSRRVRPLTSSQITAAAYLLYRCHLWMLQSEINTFHKFLKATYNLNFIQITQEQTVGLNKSLRKKIRSFLREQQKYKSVEIHQKNNRKDGFWTPRMQLQLCYTYLQYQTVSAIQSYFIRNYPEHRRSFSNDYLRGRLDHLLRLIVRKLKYEQQKYSDSQLKKANLTYRHIHYLISATQSLSYRIDLIKFHLLQKKDKNSLIQLNQKLIVFQQLAQQIMGKSKQQGQQQQQNRNNSSYQDGQQQYELQQKIGKYQKLKKLNKNRNRNQQLDQIANLVSKSLRNFSVKNNKNKSIE